VRRGKREGRGRERSKNKRTRTEGEGKRVGEGRKEKEGGRRGLTFNKLSMGFKKLCSKIKSSFFGFEQPFLEITLRPTCKNFGVTE
jgi:hypothetical protein